MSPSGPEKQTRPKNIQIFGMLAVLALNLLPQYAFGQPASSDNNVPSQPSSPGPVDSSAPPVWQQFQIHQDTPAEREAILAAREQIQLANPPQQVQPLPEQRISPNTLNR